MRHEGRAPIPRVRLTGSATATRLAVGILEVLSGVYGPAEGSRLLGLSLTRYYTVETRAEMGMLHGLGAAVNRTGFMGGPIG